MVQFNVTPYNSFSGLSTDKWKLKEKDLDVFCNTFKGGISDNAWKIIEADSDKENKINWAKELEFGFNREFLKNNKLFVYESGGIKYLVAESDFPDGKSPASITFKNGDKNIECTLYTGEKIDLPSATKDTTDTKVPNKDIDGKAAIIDAMMSQLGITNVTIEDKNGDGLISVKDEVTITDEKITKEFLDDFLDGGEFGKNDGIITVDEINKSKDMINRGNALGFTKDVYMNAKKFTKYDAENVGGAVIDKFTADKVTDETGKINWIIAKSGTSISAESITAARDKIKEILGDFKWDNKQHVGLLLGRLHGTLLNNDTYKSSDLYKLMDGYWPKDAVAFVGTESNKSGTNEKNEGTGDPAAAGNDKGKTYKNEGAPAVGSSSSNTAAIKAMSPEEAKIVADLDNGLENDCHDSFDVSFTTLWNKLIREGEWKARLFDDKNLIDGKLPPGAISLLEDRLMNSTNESWVKSRDTFKKFVESNKDNPQYAQVVKQLQAIVTKMATGKPATTTQAAPSAKAKELSSKLEYATVEGWNQVTAGEFKDYLLDDKYLDDAPDKKKKIPAEALSYLENQLFNSKNSAWIDSRSEFLAFMKNNRAGINGKFDAVTYNALLKIEFKCKMETCVKGDCAVSELFAEDFRKNFIDTAKGGILKDEYAAILKSYLNDAEGKLTKSGEELKTYIEGQDFKKLPKALQAQLTAIKDNKYVPASAPVTQQTITDRMQVIPHETPADALNQNQEKTGIVQVSFGNALPSNDKNDYIIKCGEPDSAAVIDNSLVTVYTQTENQPAQFDIKDPNVYDANNNIKNITIFYKGKAK